MALPGSQDRSAPRSRARRTVALSVALGVVLVTVGALGRWMPRGGAARKNVLTPAEVARPAVDASDGPTALVEVGSAQLGRARLVERAGEPSGSAVEGTAQPEPTWALRMRIAGASAAEAEDLVLELGLNEIEGFPVHWQGTLPLARAGAEHLAKVPMKYVRRVLALEVRSRARDLSSGIVYLGRPQASDAVLDLTLREVGELLVVVRASRGSVETAARGLDIQRLEVGSSASTSEVTAYGARVCAVERGPRLSDAPTDGGRLYERVLAGGVRVEVDELRSRSASVGGSVLRGERCVLSISLEPLDFVGALSGTIVVEGPGIPGGISVVARSVDDPTRSFQTFAFGVNDGSGVQHCTWRIEDVPSGVYEVIPMATSFLPVDPPRHTAEAPAEGLDFSVRNESEIRWCDWSVIDARSRAPLENVWVDLERRDGTLRSVRLDRSPAERFPRNGDVRWTVRCEGYESATGTLAACNRAEPRATRTDPLELGDKRMQEVWVCDLELEPSPR